MNSIIPNLIHCYNSTLVQLPVQGCSISSPYVPVLNMYKEAKSVFIKNHKGEINILYSMFQADSYSPRKKWQDLVSYYNYEIVPQQWINKQNLYHISKGMISTDNNEILLVVAIESKTALSFDIRNPDYSKMVVIVSKEFEKKHHSLLWNKIKKEFFTNCPIDIIKTNDVKKYCMNLPKLVPPFSTFQEMKQYFQNLNSILCLKNQSQK